MRGVYRDRTDAGRRLAEALDQYQGRDDVLVLGLPRGGVPVAAEVAERLRLPLDIFVVRKLGLPEQPELAMGAIATGGNVVVNPEVVDALGVPDEVVERVSADERRELERREQAYRGERPPPRLRGRTVILVDDGLATGASMRAAIAAARAQQPRSVIVAVPVAPPSTCATIREEADELVAPLQPEPFMAVGAWYEHFDQIGDDEVRAALARHRDPRDGLQHGLAEDQD